MARTKNSFLTKTEILEKRQKFFHFYIDNNIQINLLDVNDNFRFGKYLDCPIIETIKNKPEYIEWIIDNTEKCFDFSSILDLVSGNINKQHLQLNSIKLEMKNLQNENIFNIDKILIIPEYILNVT